MATNDSTAPSSSRRSQKAPSPIVVDTPPQLSKTKGRKQPKEKKRQRSCGSPMDEGESHQAKRPRKESPKDHKGQADEVTESPNAVSKGTRKIVNQLQIDMVPGAFQPETPKRKRRSVYMLFLKKGTLPTFLHRFFFTKNRK